MRELIEFYCNDCDGWFRVNLNLEIDGDFLFVCPECAREHPRTVAKGELTMKTKIDSRILSGGEGGRVRRGGNGKERILVPKSSYSKKSQLKAIEHANKGFFAQAWAKLAAKEEA